MRDLFVQINRFMKLANQIKNEILFEIFSIILLMNNDCKFTIKTINMSYFHLEV